MTGTAVCRLAIWALQLAVHGRPACRSASLPVGARFPSENARIIVNQLYCAVLMRRASANISQPTRANQTRLPAHGCMAMTAFGFVIAGRGWAGWPACGGYSLGGLRHSRCAAPL